jgi:polyhydroxyalkanoate synthesis regulator phasin
VTPAPDSSLPLSRLEDAVASLRTWLAVVGVLAVVALGVATYALTRANGTTGSRGGLASDERVSRVADRVDRLSREVQGLRTARGTPAGAANDSAALGGRLDALERTVRTLSDRPSTDASQAVQDLAGRIDDLARDVEQLKQAQTPP